MLTWSSRGDRVGDRRARTESIQRRQARTDSTSIVSSSRARTGRRLSAASDLWSSHRIRSTSLSPPSTVVHLPSWWPPRLTIWSRRLHTPLSTCCPYNQPRRADKVGTRHSELVEVRKLLVINTTRNTTLKAWTVTLLRCIYEHMNTKKISKFKTYTTKNKTKATPLLRHCNTGRSDRTCLPLLITTRENTFLAIYVVQKITIIHVCRKSENSRFEIWYSVLVPSGGAKKIWIWVHNCKSSRIKSPKTLFF